MFKRFFSTDSRDTKRNLRNFRNFFLGLLLTILLLVFFFGYLPIATKVVGQPFLWLPASLGLLEPVDSERIQPLSFTAVNEPVYVAITRPGRYTVYADDIVLLQTAVNSSSSLFTIQAEASQDRVQVNIINRGVRPYDPVAARGRPLYTFQAEAGFYEIRPLVSAAVTGVDLVPDPITGNERIYNLLYIAQLVGLLAAGSTFYYLRNRDQILSRKEARRQKRARADAWLKSNRK